ncbi:MAG: hypothetical protein NDJ92_09690 [Thermoanaerobaculia bacterium]|nr:hypothetical protein [Thermoanaerobaculia bacterium]
MHFNVCVALVALLCVPLTGCAKNGRGDELAQGGSSREEIAGVLSTLAVVYDTALIFESLKAEHGALPRVATPAELSRVRFGSDALTDELKDGWSTPLHVESDPSGGYVVAAAGADRRFDRRSWSTPGATRSAADDIVLRDGKLVRSPADWAVAAAEELAGGTLRDHMQAMRTVSPQQKTISDLRSIASAALTYEVTKGSLPAVKSMSDLAQLLEPDLIASVPRTDGWGRRYNVEIEPSSRLNRIVSPGPDGVLDPPSWSDPSKASDDIVMQDFDITRNSEVPASPKDALSEAYVDYIAARGRLEQR